GPARNRGTCGGEGGEGGHALMPLRTTTAALAILTIAASSRPAAAQAWAPRAREGDVTLVVQTIDHLGRVFKDVRFDCCETTSVAAVVDAHYGLTDRWSFSVGLPYVFAKYSGEDPLPPT